EDANHKDVAVFFGSPVDGLGGKTLLPIGTTDFFRGLIAHVDGDGHLDLLLDGVLPAMRWIRGHRNGSFDPAQAAGPRPGAAELRATDVDGDGLADMLDAQIGGHLEFRKGAGNGAFANPANVGLTDQPSDLMVSDLDDDGVLDCALVDEGEVVVRQGLGGG